MNGCERRFYSPWRILRRVADSFPRRRRPVLSLVTNLSYRNNARLTGKSYAELDLPRGNLWRVGPPRRESHERSVPADNPRLGPSCKIGANRPTRSART